MIKFKDRAQCDGLRFKACVMMMSNVLSGKRQGHYGGRIYMYNDLAVHEGSEI